MLAVCNQMRGKRSRGFMNEEIEKNPGRRHGKGVRRLKQALAWMLIWLVLGLEARAQRPLRFSLQTDILDLTNCVAQPGNVPIPLAATNANIEILDWTTKAVNTNAPGEFLLKFKQPTMVGTLLQYEGGEVFAQVGEEWKAVPAPLEAARKLQTVPLPFGEPFSALKIRVQAEKTNGLFQSRLSFATLIPVRAINVAVTAEASASSVAPDKKPSALVDGVLDAKENFSTAPRKDKPEWITLMWGSPQRFRGLGLFRGSADAGLGEPLIETYFGNGDPAQATGTNGWKSVFTRSTAPGTFRANRFYVAMEMQETRGLRLTATGEVSRIGLGEVVVFQDLGAAAAPTNLVSQERKSYTIAKVEPGKIKIDGNDDDWPAERIEGFALRYDDDNLYVVFKGKDAQATFENKGTNYTELFHTGDALDVMLQARPGLSPGRIEPAPGDVRLLFAMFEGKPVCVFYNFRLSDLLSQPVTFKSPTKTVWVDKLDLVKEAKVEVKRGEGEYTLEASVPLRAIHVLPAALAETRGDVGRVLSDASGAKAVQRVYWSNKNAPPPGDIVEEASVQPAHWGTFKFAE
jgi:hypothetical protein